MDADAQTDYIINTLPIRIQNTEVIATISNNLVGYTKNANSKLSKFMKDPDKKTPNQRFSLGWLLILQFFEIVNELELSLTRPPMTREIINKYQDIFDRYPQILTNWFCQNFNEHEDSENSLREYINILTKFLQQSSHPTKNGINLEHITVDKNQQLKNEPIAALIDDPTYNNHICYTLTKPVRQMLIMSYEAFYTKNKDHQFDINAVEHDLEMAHLDLGASYEKISRTSHEIQMQFSDDVIKDGKNFLHHYTQTNETKFSNTINSWLTGLNKTLKFLNGQIKAVNNQVENITATDKESKEDRKKERQLKQCNQAYQNFQRTIIKDRNILIKLSTKLTNDLHFYQPKVTNIQDIQHTFKLTPNIKRLNNEFKLLEHVILHQPQKIFTPNLLNQPFLHAHGQAPDPKEVKAIKINQNDTYLKQQRQQQKQNKQDAQTFIKLLIKHLTNKPQYTSTLIVNNPDIKDFFKKHFTIVQRTLILMGQTSIWNPTTTKTKSDLFDTTIIQQAINKILKPQHQVLIAQQPSDNHPLDFVAINPNKNASKRHFKFRDLQYSLRTENKTKKTTKNVLS